MKACVRHEQNCYELVKHTFPGGKYDKRKSVFDKIEDLYNNLIEKEKTYIMYHSFNPVVDNQMTNITPMNAHLILRLC